MYFKYFLKAQNALLVGVINTGSGCKSVFQTIFLTILNYFGQPLGLALILGYCFPLAD